MKVENLIAGFDKKYSECLGRLNKFKTLGYHFSSFPEPFYIDVISNLKTVLADKELYDKSSLEKLIAICERRSKFEIVPLLGFIAPLLFSLLKVFLASDRDVWVLFLVFGYIIWLILFAIKVRRTAKYERILPYLEEISLKANKKGYRLK